MILGHPEMRSFGSACTLPGEPVTVNRVFSGVPGKLNRAFGLRQEPPKRGLALRASIVDRRTSPLAGGGAFAGAVSRA